MRIYAHLALAYLKKQRGRTIALISGVALAVMLVFGYNVISESQNRNQLSNIYKMYGTYHGIFTNLNKDMVSKIKNDKNVSKSAVSPSLGDLVTENGILIALNSTDKDYIRMNGYTLAKGRLPNSQGEIVLESQALKKMKREEKLGQVMNLKVQKQYKDENGMNQTYMKTKPFKLVGILDKPKKYYEGYYLLRGFTYFKEGARNVLPNHLITYEEIVKLKSKSNLSEQLNQIRERYNRGKLDYIENGQLLQALDEFINAKNTDSFKNQFNIIIIVAAILLIYNMFNLSLVNMIRQIGMLRAIGSSKKHVRLLIGFQSLFILIIGLVVGLIMGIIFSYIGIKFFNFTFLDASQSSVYISAKNIWNAVIIGTITVIVSSIVPIWISGKISPVEAIKKSDKTGRQKTRAYHRAIKKIFGITGEMAYKNVWRNKWKTLIIIVSVAMAGYLFIFYIGFFYRQDSFINTIDPKILSMQDSDFKLSFGLSTDPNSTGYTNKDLKAISNIEGVKQVGTKASIYGFLETDIKDLQEEFKKENGIFDTNKNVEVAIEVKGYDDNQLQKFQKYVDKGHISTLNDLSNKYPNVIVSNYHYNSKNSDIKGIQKDLNIGDIITIRIPVVQGDHVVYKELKARVSALLKQEWILKGDSTKGSYMEVILPQKYLMNISEKNAYNQVSVQCEPGKETYVNKEINKILENKPLPNVESKLGYKEQNRKGFLSRLESNMVIVVLILFIAAMNVYNTIKANLLIRTNEFSTLRAIGMTVKQLKNMIIKESICYGILSSIIAALIGGYNVYAVYEKINMQYSAGYNINKTVQYNIPIIPILFYSCIVIAIFVLSAYISARRAEKLNIVEGLNIIE